MKDAREDARVALCRLAECINRLRTMNCQRNPGDDAIDRAVEHIGVARNLAIQLIREAVSGPMLAANWGRIYRGNRAIAFGDRDSGQLFVLIEPDAEEDRRESEVHIVPLSAVFGLVTPKGGAS